MAQRHGLGRALRAGSEEHHGRVVGVDTRQARRSSRRGNRYVASSVAQRPRSCRPCDSQVFEEDVFGPLDLDAQPVDQLPRRDHAANVEFSTAWARLAGPVVQFSITGSLPARCRAKKTRSAATEAGSSTPIASPGKLAESLAQQPRADQQPAVGQHAGELVGHGHVVGMREARGGRRPRRASRPGPRRPGSLGGRLQASGTGPARLPKRSAALRPGPTARPASRPRGRSGSRSGLRSPARCPCGRGCPARSGPAWSRGCFSSSPSGRPRCSSIISLTAWIVAGLIFSTSICPPPPIAETGRSAGRRGNGRGRTWAFPDRRGCTSPPGSD